MTDTLQYLTRGTWVAGAAGDTADDLNPSDNREVLARYSSMSTEQVRDVVESAVTGARTWRRTSPIERGAVLSRAAARLRAGREELGAIVSSENGKTLAEATVEVEKCADFFDFYAATCRMPLGSILADGRPGTQAMALSEPIGVVVAITPWNDPMLTPARKLGPALAAGNSVILKPAPDTPLAAYHLARALDEAGLPGGVLATVITDHDTLGRVVLDDPRVAGVTFTGSTATGRLLQQRLAGRGVRLQTEMGGKNAAVVLADADLDLAVATIGAAAFGQAGQRCTATSRVLVASSIHDEVVGRLAALAQGLVLGRSTEPGTTMGPLVSAVQRERVLAHLSGASGEGLTVVTGGGVPDAESLRHGCFVEPTVLTGMTADKAIWRDEVFGPVIGVRAIGSLDEAVEAVNDSPYGLSASLFTVDLRSANRFVQEVDAGQVAVNLPTSGWDVHQPFGGFKDSGSAFKEQGLEGLRFYTRVKTAAIRSSW